MVCRASGFWAVRETQMRQFHDKWKFSPQNGKTNLGCLLSIKRNPLTRSALKMTQICTNSVWFDTNQKLCTSLKALWKSNIGNIRNSHKNSCSTFKSCQCRFQCNMQVTIPKAIFVIWLSATNHQFLFCCCRQIFIRSTCFESNNWNDYFWPCYFWSQKLNFSHFNGEKWQKHLTKAKLAAKLF